MDTIQILADKAWEHMHSERFWATAEMSLHKICKDVANKERLKVNPAQIRLAAKQIERRLV